jgi:hypothetical protein
MKTCDCVPEKFKYTHVAGHQWLTPVSLSTQEAEIRIVV